MPVSSDGGTTWKAVDVDRVDENSFPASYRNPTVPDGDGYVSVRTKVWDGVGSRTTRTIIRAYALK